MKKEEKFIQQSKKMLQNLLTIKTDEPTEQTGIIHYGR